MSDTLLGYEDLDGDVWCNCGECAEARNAEDSDNESDMFQYCQPCTTAKTSYTKIQLRNRAPQMLAPP